MRDDDLGKNDGAENGEEFILEVRMTGLDWMWENRKRVMKRSQKIEWLYHREGWRRGRRGGADGENCERLSKPSFPSYGAHKESSSSGVLATV